MKKTAIALAAALAASLTLGTAALAGGEKGEVHVYNWSDYIGEGVLEKFEKATGYKVIYDTFDSNEILETKLLTGHTGYDVVVPSATFLARQIQAGVFQKLDKSKLPNLKYVWPEIAQRVAAYDPGNQYSVNYMWGTTGIGYNIDKVREVLGDDAPVDSWALVFDPKYMKKLAECGVHFLDAPTEMIPAALNYIGEDPDSHDPAVIRKAEPVLMAVRPYVRKFHSSEYINALANGDICVAIGWSGDVLQARDRADEADNGVHIAYSIPKEGAVMWFDQMAIPADAPNPEGAHAFINFMLDPKIAAENTNYVWYANGVEESKKYIDPEILDDTAVYPDEATLKKLYVTTPYDLKTQRLVTRIWTRIKTGH